MGVITTRGSDYDIHTAGTNCSICNAKLHPPFVVWMCTGGPVGDLFFCGPCCRRIKDGIMADMIQAAAIVDLESLGDRSGYYSSQTLIRKSIKDVEAEALAMNHVDRLRFVRPR